MCDTLVALPSATADGSTLLAKNSDREPNEAQAICAYPRQSFPADATLKCTYITIPQVRETHAVLLSRPFWMWGAEMGVNEHGVAIGNEAVFTRLKVAATGLTGMDLLRLGLERADTAARAVEVITDLLQTYGQGGNGGYQHNLFYHNSFLIADRREAWVLETADRRWAARRVTEVASISNGLTIGGEFDLASEDLIPYAMQRGWRRGPEDFAFARCYSDISPAPSMSFIYTRFSGCLIRQPHTLGNLRAQAGRLTVADMMAFLRSHGPAAEGHPYTPAAGSNGSICMHFADELIRGSQTTGSLVAQLRPDGTVTCWLTGASAPCLSLFKPFYLDTPLPDMGPTPTGHYDPAAHWWQGERLHRATLLDYATRAASFTAERDAIEASFLAEEVRLRSAAVTERGAFSAGCCRRASAALAAWTDAVAAMSIAQAAPWLYRRRWARQNQAAGMGQKG